MTQPVSAHSGVPSPARLPRPALMLAAVDMARGGGSEPGRAWDWACALARHYDLHVVTGSNVAERCRREKAAAGWTWHTTTVAAPTSSGLAYYRDYRRWCREAEGVLHRVLPQVRPVGLHHITLGSFRVLPRYDRFEVPFTLGPIGGGESTPRELLGTARLPPGPWISEFLRPWLNGAFAAVPALRAVMRRSQLALATSQETEAVLRRMGARTTAVVFPDRVPPDLDASRAMSAAERAAELPRCVRLVWSGRAVWWKAGQIAVELLRRLRRAGVEAELSCFTYGHALPAWRRQMAAAGVGEHCRVSGFVPQAELHAVLGRAHVFVYPTLHDSACPALLEAYALGLPSLTVGLGGPAVVATPATGGNFSTKNLDAWIDRAVDCVRGWRDEPAAWLAASRAAQARAADFGPAQLEAIVDRWLGPGTYRR